MSTLVALALTCAISPDAVWNELEDTCDLLLPSSCVDTRRDVYEQYTPVVRPIYVHSATYAACADQTLFGKVGTDLIGNIETLEDEELYTSLGIAPQGSLDFTPYAPTPSSSSSGSKPTVPGGSFGGTPSSGGNDDPITCCTVTEPPTHEPPVAAVPLPASFWMLLAALGMLIRRQTRN